MRISRANRYSGPTILIVRMKYVRDTAEPVYPGCADLVGHEGNLVDTATQQSAWQHDLT